MDAIAEHKKKIINLAYYVKCATFFVLSVITSPKRVPFSYICLLSVIACVFFVLNPSNSRHDYGDHYGRYDEKGDSYSDFFVRNTIKNKILGYDKKGFFLVRTKGYIVNRGKGDYDYYSDGITLHHTGLYIHGYIASKIAQFFDLKDEKSIDRFIFMMRMSFAFLLTLCLLSFYNYTAVALGINGVIVVPIMGYITISTYGYILFAQNLYYAFSLYLLPLLFFSCIYKLKGSRFYCGYLLVGVFLLAYFRALCSFSHLPPYCIMIVFFALLTKPEMFKVPIVSLNIKDIKFMLRIGVIAFLGASLGIITFYILIIDRMSIPFFSIESFIHVFSAHTGVQWEHRTTIPHSMFSIEFIKAMYDRFQCPALVLWPSSIVISQWVILLVMIFFFLVAVFRFKKTSFFEVSAFVVGIIGYMSVYSLGLRYIMVHKQYDWPLFAITIMLGLGLLTIFYSSLLLDFVKSRLKIPQGDKQAICIPKARSSP